MMSQTEIYNFMRNLRLTGDDRYYTPKEIEKMLAANHIEVIKVADKLTRLWWYKFMEKSKVLSNKRETLYNRRLFRAVP